MAYLVLVLIASAIMSLAGIPFLATAEGYALFAPIFFLMRTKREWTAVSWYFQVIVGGAWLGATLYTKGFTHNWGLLLLLLVVSGLMGFAFRWLMKRQTAREPC